MIWLASFPRSGNTFFRAILSEVYGVDSGEYSGKEKADRPDDNTYQVIKTHLLPNQLVPSDPSIPAVYIIRDGRDALVSLAHQRQDMVDLNSDYKFNLREAILAEDGTFFGGWSKNVNEWLERANVVIKFEDLIANPIDCVELIRPYFPELPKPNRSKLPTFQDLRNKDMKYNKGSVLGFPLEEIEKGKEKFFRRGKAGSWKDEMPDQLQKLFWQLHGKTMKKMGYTEGINTFSFCDIFKKNILTKKQRFRFGLEMVLSFFTSKN